MIAQGAALVLATGLLIGEASGLTWDGVDMKQKTVLVKSQLPRTGTKLVLKPLKTEKSLRQEDAEFENEQDLVFLNPWGRPFDP